MTSLTALVASLEAREDRQDLETRKSVEELHAEFAALIQEIRAAHGAEVATLRQVIREAELRIEDVKNELIGLRERALEKEAETPPYDREAELFDMGKRSHYVRKYGEEP